MTEPLKKEESDQQQGKVPPVVFPYLMPQYRYRTCVCGKDECSQLMKKFQRILDVRGSWFLIPDECYDKPWHKRKRESVRKHLLVDKIPKGSVVAMHHFPPAALQRYCYHIRKHGNGAKTAVYRWIVTESDRKNDRLSAEPNYPLSRGQDDFKTAVVAISDAPTYSSKARQTTIIMSNLLLKDKKERNDNEKKRISDFSADVRRLKRLGRRLPLQKEVTLQMAGFDFVGGKYISRTRKKKAEKPSET